MGDVEVEPGAGGRPVQGRLAVRPDAEGQGRGGDADVAGEHGAHGAPRGGPAPPVALEVKARGALALVGRERRRSLGLFRVRHGEGDAPDVHASRVEARWPQRRRRPQGRRR